MTHSSLAAQSACLSSHACVCPCVHAPGARWRRGRLSSSLGKVASASVTLPCTHYHGNQNVCMHVSESRSEQPYLWRHHEAAHPSVSSLCAILHRRDHSCHQSWHAAPSPGRPVWLGAMAGQPASHGSLLCPCLLQGGQHTWGDGALSGLRGVCTQAVRRAWWAGPPVARMVGLTKVPGVCSGPRHPIVTPSSLPHKFTAPSCHLEPCSSSHARRPAACSRRGLAPSSPPSPSPQMCPCVIGLGSQASRCRF